MDSSPANGNAGLNSELDMPHQSSIRDELEADAWRRHWTFARRLARNRRPARRAAPPARRPLKWEDRALLILAAILLALLIVRVETVRADGPGNGFFGLEFEDQAGVQRKLALDTDIQVEISGLTARVEVTQAFQNTGKHWAEAVYRYPLPPGSAVDRMRVHVGDRVLEGEIREKTEARRQYQQAKSSGKVASLVDQQRSNQFETRLANIGPGDEIRVSISFLARVEYRDGSFSLQIPMTFTPRFENSQADTEPLLIAGMAGSNGSGDPLRQSSIDDHYLTLDVDLRSGMNLASIESRYHDVDIHPSLNGYRVFLTDPDTRTDRVFELIWTPEFGTAPESTLSTFDDGESVYALLMLAPPLAEAVSPRAREVVFVIDTSGSMEGTSMLQAKAALKLGLGFLGPDDRFNLVRFSSDTEQLWNESVPAYPAYLEEAEEFIDDLSANGGTVMAPALGAAMTLPEQTGLLRQIVFVTDGSVGNEQELLVQIGEDLGDSRLFTVSIGSAPNAWFMRKAAEIGRGSHTHVGRLEEVKDRISALWSRIENPAITNLCVDWGMDAEFYPELIPDLYAGEPLWLYARLPHEPRDVLVCGELDGNYWEMQSRTMPAAGSENLATLWARSKIEALEDSRLFGTDPDAIRASALDLALEFGLLTRYTSLVAVDKTPSRPVADGLMPENVPSLLPAGSGMASGFSGTATGWLAQCLLAALSLFVATGMLLYLPPCHEASTRVSSGARSPMT
jgi:Ca-activated chloride channel family protein